MRFLPLLPLLMMLLAAPAIAKPADKVQNRTVVGWVEKVKLADVDVVVKARMDTGAGLSSVDAEIVKIIPAEAGSTRESIVFQIEDSEGNKKTLQRDIVKWVNIKKKDKSGFIRRPVVRMDFCLGGKKIQGRINLADRQHFLYPLLIGRNILDTGQFLIDPTQTFLHKPLCNSKTKPE